MGVTKTVAGGAINLAFDTTTADSLRLRVKTAPTPPYTITAAFALTGLADRWSVVNLGWRNSSSGKIAVLLYGRDYIASISYNTPTNYNAWYAQKSWRCSENTIWFQISDDNSNRIIRISRDGANWLEIHSVARTDFFTPDQVCWGGQGDGFAANVTLFSWTET